MYNQVDFSNLTTWTHVDIFSYSHPWT